MNIDDYEEETLRDHVKEFIALCKHIPNNELDNVSVSTKRIVETTASHVIPVRESMTGILEWFNEIKQKLSSTSDKLDTIKTDPKRCTLSEKIIYLLRQCVITHRWVNVAQLLQPLSQESCNNLTAVWKLSMEIMMKNPKIYHDVVDKLVRQLMSSGVEGTLDKHEILLDYLLFLLSQGKYSDIKDLPVIKKGARKIDTTRMIEVKTLYSAYSGLVWYNEWSELKEEIGQTKDSQDVLSSYHGSQSVSNIRLKMNTLVERMCNCWKSLADKTGVWDVFLYKLVEVYEERGELKEAEDILLQYQKTNYANISIYKQLYYLYSSNQFPKVYIIKSLKNLVKVDPSSVKVLKLYQLLKDDPSEMNYLSSVLFTIMDYSIWKDSEEAWCIFTSHIINVFTSQKKHIKKANREWKSREDIWSGYHFNINSVDPRWTSPKVLEQKSICCALFCVSDNPYTTAAWKHLHRHQWTRIQSVIDECQVT